ncbi:MAG: NADH:flavin oxidoreductase [Deltaproteobacteria bacterium]|nr:NADH:flavin oxidoreductase [Deltaproteobacteria bacterium]
MENNIIFTPFTIKNVTFKNRILRSSIGGRTAYYNGTINAAWKHFEKRFAENEVAGIISATLTVDGNRWSPLEYPQISKDDFIGPLQEGIQEVQKLGCKYIIQIGDPGCHTQTSLFRQRADAMSASRGFDFLYGYRNTNVEMSVGDIKRTIDNFAKAARRAQKTGCDGLEITASKGYLIHQFLNPAINRRTDEYGGSEDGRFLFLRRIVEAVNEKIDINKNFLFGIRLSAVDYNYLPLLNIRWPVWPLVRPFRHYFIGNGLKETLGYAQKLKELGIDYLHITSGYGFINPQENPGRFPTDEIRMFFNSVRHLSAKAKARAMLLNILPNFIINLLMGITWKVKEGINADFAAKFKDVVQIPIVANGGFQTQSLIKHVLDTKKCDMVSMARPLLANPDLLKIFKEGEDKPKKPCSFCNKCAARTTLFPLGCYERSRFHSQEEMEKEIIRWSGTPG